MSADVFALFFSYLLYDCGGRGRLCIIEHIKVDRKPASPRFRKQLVFVLALEPDAYIVLGYSFQHVVALADVNQLIADAD